MEPQVVFEDKTILIIDKPSGWVVNEASTVGKTPVVQTWIKKGYEFETLKDIRYRSGIVHRIDKETSGLLIIAKTKNAFSQIQKQFKDRKVNKVYVALVHGSMELDEDSISTPVGRLPWNRERFGVIPGGRKAETSYVTKKRYQHPKSKEVFSFLKVFPKTGRTHQIRIHLKYIGHPIVSDEFYSGRKVSKSDRKWCPRLFLHAGEIEFNHPGSGKTVEYKSKLSKDLSRSLNKLKKV